MSDRFTHLDEAGAARMVDVGDKAVTARTATATGRVDLSAETVALLRGQGVPKGDALAVARVADITDAVEQVRTGCVNRHRRVRNIPTSRSATTIESASAAFQENINRAD